MRTVHDLMEAGLIKVRFFEDGDVDMMTIDKSLSKEEQKAAHDWMFAYMGEHYLSKMYRLPKWWDDAVKG